MTDEKPSAAEQLAIFKTDPAAFWLEVSRAISEQPWEHRLMGFDCLRNGMACAFCEAITGEDGVPSRESCRVPPPLTEPPEVVAMTLNRRLEIASRHHFMAYAAIVKPPIVDLAWWVLWEMSVEQEVAGYLVARGQWRP